MNYSKTSKLINEEFEKEIIPNLSEFIRIDNLSPFFDKDWNNNGKQEKCADFCLKWALSQKIKGLKGEIIKDEDKTPLIFIEIEASDNNQKAPKSIMLYGHFDKQPHFEGWAPGLGPISPIIKDGKLYGRGGADDGYSLFSSILAIKTIQENQGNHGKIFIIIEGSEESGSPHLMHYIESLKDQKRLGSIDLMICLDSGALTWDTLWITKSLRGCCVMDITVEILEEAVHSGIASGLIPDSFMILRNILDRIEDSKTGEIIPKELNVEIPEKRIQDANKVANLLGAKVLDKIKILEGVKPASNNFTELILNTTWRPRLTVTGQLGLPKKEMAGNVLRKFSTLRISVRLPPTLDAKIALESLDEIVKKNPPFNAKISTEKRNPSSGWCGKEFSEKLENALKNSSRNLFGNEFQNYGGGGSIPFIKQLADNFLDCEILVMGVLGPKSNAHACNEFLDIEYCKKITGVLAHVINDFCD